MAGYAEARWDLVTLDLFPFFRDLMPPLAAFSPPRFTQRWPTGASLCSYALDTTAQRA